MIERVRPKRMGRAAPLPSPGAKPTVAYNGG